MATASGRHRASSRGTAGEGQRGASSAPADGAAPAASIAWSLRVRRIGGLIQTAFAALWLVRGAHAVGGDAGAVLLALAGAAVIATLAYAVKVTSGTAPRPRDKDGKRIERLVTAATIIELVAAFVLPVIVSAAGHSDWVLPSIAVTIGPLLLYLDRLVQIPRYRPVGWALTLGPLVLVATLSGSALIATTGIVAGVLLLATALAGFRDLARLSRSGERAAGAEHAVTGGAAP